MKIWRTKKNHDKRIRQMHPWVFSNELEESPKGILPGEAIELRDFKNEFLARGFGNPQSLISFRALSYNPNIQTPLDEYYLVSRLIKSWDFRRKMGFTESFRLCFSEVDQIPGLIIDYYNLYEQSEKTKQLEPAESQLSSAKTIGQALVIQLSSSGMDRALNKNINFFKKLIEAAYEARLTKSNWENTALIFRNDLNVRKLEGLEYEEPLVAKNIEHEIVDLSDCDIGLNAMASDRPLLMRVDLVNGQKTGFFLDQVFNIEIVAQRLEKILKTNSFNFSKTIRILDLCCYAGHWSAQLTLLLNKYGVESQVTLVDVSTKALESASLNVTRCGGIVETKKMNVLEHLPQLSDQSYDIVISDPPAFIKNKKDLPTGQHAYFKLNTQAFRLCRPNGLVVCCSCSGSLSEEDFLDTIKKAQFRANRQSYCIARGGPSVDHPMVLNFPEGHYLKMYLFVAEPVMLEPFVAGTK